ncbi:MAG: capsular polysaccharide biosynthesis protein [Clostridia bacterium]|nr:capsular polysaccharide biosynthesis protein [Clostridia bacterium]
MIDWHSHILPEMDDGSRDTAESISMINVLRTQGVGTVIATPHFYANDESVDSFLERRKSAFERLSAELPEGSPEILLGAEVRYYQGINRMADLKALRIEGTKLLLLEMPMSSWTEYMVRELIEMSGRSSIKVVLAHVERYMALQKQSVWNRLLESGILMQVNASFFTSFASKRKALSLLREGSVHFVGSDSHNMSSRPPRVGKAFEVIQKKLGENYLKQMNEYGHSLLVKVNK